MIQLDDARFTDGAIDSIAIRASLDLAALLVDFLACLLALGVVSIRAAQFFEICLAIGFEKENARTILNETGQLYVEKKRRIQNRGSREANLADVL